MDQNLGTIADTISAEANAELDRLAREAPRGYGRRIAGQTRYYARRTDHLAHEHVWKTMGIAMVVGLALGLMMVRR